MENGENIEPEQSKSEPTAQTTMIYQTRDIKNPGMAAVLSFICTGLGQVYNGQIGRGIALIGLQIFNILLMFVIIGFITFPITWIYGVYDAYITAQTHNQEVALWLTKRGQG